MRDETFLQHTELVFPREGNQPLVEPIYQSVKFTFSSFSELTKKTNDDYFYTRVGNPTVRYLEKTLARLQKRQDAIAFASGVGAIHTLLFSLLKADDHVIFFAECYRPTRIMIRKHFAKFGVQHTMLHMDEIDQLEKHIKKGKTKLILMESPTNPILRVPDLEKVIQMARKYDTPGTGVERIAVALDNTFAGFHHHGEFDIDIYIHSLTKYASGHGDVMGGMLIGNPAYIDPIRSLAVETGACMDPQAAFLISRGMKTYSLRFQRQSQNAMEIAEFLAAHPKTQAVYYPGLKTHPDHKIAKRQMRDFGAIVSLEIKGDRGGLERFVDRLSLFALAGSLGSTESLVSPSKYFFGGDLSEEQQKRVCLFDNSVRLSIGIENVEDLKSDLGQALDGV